MPIVQTFVMPKSMIYTDEWHAYDKLGQIGYRHHRINHSQGIYVAGNVHANTIEGFFGHFKTDVRGTHHSISRRSLQGYLNEWVWKWNRRDDEEAMSRQLLRSAATARALGRAVRTASEGSAQQGPDDTPPSGPAALTSCASPSPPRLNSAMASDFLSRPILVPFGAS
jgi:transposase-like protein